MCNYLNKKLIKNLVLLLDSEIYLVCSLIRNYRLQFPDMSYKELFKFFSSSNKSDAEYVLSQLYRWGLGGELNSDLAFSWCLKSNEKNYIPAKLVLAGYYLSEPMKLNSNEGLKLINESIESAYVPAINLLALIYENGMFKVRKSVNKALNLYVKGVQLGDSYSMCMAANILLNDKKLSNPERGIYLLEKAASNGNPLAHSYLGYCYINGDLGFEKCMKKAKYHAEMQLSLENKLVKECLIDL